MPMNESIQEIDGMRKEIERYEKKVQNATGERKKRYKDIIRTYAMGLRLAKIKYS